MSLQNKRTFLLLLFIVVTNLYGVNSLAKNIQKDGESLALLTANPIYQLDEIQLPIILKNFLQSKKYIKGVEVYENLEHSLLMKYYREDHKIYFNKNLPKNIKKYSQHKQVVTYENNSVGYIIIYYTKHIDLSNKEKKWLKTNPVIKFCCDPNWMPYEAIKDGEYVGIASDYLKLFETKLGVKFKLIPTKNWSETKQKGKDRECDIFPLSSDSEQRKTYMNVTKPYFIEPLVLATNMKKRFINDLSQLDGKTIAMTQGYAIINRIREKYPQLNIIETDNIHTSLHMIVNEEVYGLIDATSTVNYYIENFYPAQVKISSKLDTSYLLGIASNKEKPILNSILTKTIDSISKEEREQIFNKWNKQKIIIEKADYTLLFQAIAVFVLILIILLYQRYKSLKHQDILNEKNKQLQLADDELRRSNERLTIAAKASFDLLYEWDVQTDSLYWYGDVDSFLGFEKGEISENIEAWLALIHPDDVRMLSHAVEDHRAKTTELSYEYRIRTKQGIYQHWQDHALPILDEQNKPQRWIGVCIDITNKKRTEEQLIKSEKMAAIGEMMGNIAHQWRQPLSIISTASTGMKIQRELNLLKDDEFDRNCNLINDNAQFLSNTIDDFKNFIKGDREVVRFNLREKVDSFLNLVDPSSKTHKLNVIVDIDKELTLHGYPNELIQCFINLFNNSKDILNEKELKDKYIFISAVIKKDQVVISFKDNGEGIPTDILPRIFEPYFTTKHQSQGTGLGLHMTYNLIVNGMNGSIDAQTVTYEYKNKTLSGAEFIITLPLH